MSARAGRLPVAAPAIAFDAAAVLVSDHTCERVLGVEWRVVRRHCKRHGVAIRKIGRRPVVRLDHLLAVLGLADAPSPPASSPRLVDEDMIVQLAARRGSK